MKIDWLVQASHAINMLACVDKKYGDLINDEKFVTDFANYLKRFKGNATILDAISFADAYYGTL
jgi:tryptophan synthase beta subunit